jgi:hypothetical protein
MIKRHWMIGVALLVIVSTLWWARYALDPDSTYTIAEGMFDSLARHEGVNVADFESPARVRDDDPLLLTLRWSSRSQPGCGIEVDVDRKYVSARPRVYCAPGLVWKSGRGH